jgi:hypothetical protein
MVKKEKTEKVEEVKSDIIDKKIPKATDLEWTDYVLSLLSEDEKISGNPTTDGLRRIFEIALNCRVVVSSSKVVQSPDPNNEKRATVVHSVVYLLNDASPDRPEFNTVSVDGAADVYWGNCDKVYRNHPVAVAETRAEGRALRRALKLRKVVAAEEISSIIEDNPDGDSVSRITSNQINFIDVIAKRIDINPLKLFETLGIEEKNVKNIDHDRGVEIIRELSKYQQSVDTIPADLKGYSDTWKGNI